MSGELVHDFRILRTRTDERFQCKRSNFWESRLVGRFEQQLVCLGALRIVGERFLGEFHRHERIFFYRAAAGDAKRGSSERERVSPAFVLSKRCCSRQLATIEEAGRFLQNSQHELEDVAMIPDFIRMFCFEEKRTRIGGKFLFGRDGHIAGLRTLASSPVADNGLAHLFNLKVP